MESDNSSAEIPISEPPYCVGGHLNIIPGYIRVIAAITCALSILGAALIILSYVFFKDLRNKAREVIVHISAMDLLTVAANLFGIIINFDSHLYHEDPLVLPPHYETYNTLCKGQATIAVFGNLSSVLWTIAIAVYFYICIMTDNKKTAKRSLYFFYLICYGLPLLIVVWFLPTGKLGYAPVGGSGWCSFVIDSNPTEKLDSSKKLDSRDIITLFFGNSLWMYVSFIIIPFICISLLVYLRLKTKKKEISNQDKLRMNMIEVKLLAVPIIFVFLRIWSELLGIITVYSNNKSCTLVTILLVLGGIGDSGQGFFNALIFCLLNAKVRSAYFKCIKKSYKACKTWKCEKIEMKSRLIVNPDEIDTDQASTQE
ncbi:PREDICTED: probable G-protein coupled receptor 157 [Amphimedon queenslandica]|uniref:G-protein coupled receptors family 2 profile 2 domain-containing protein n=1 Tax=Amphimedon queenslandica TaxID=400682 RepID=A0A1X7UQX9_AMPQE|nr:PREDICTED: probable G-protein coupled receptor 157 [Amphimedon queenslandica]|eukprot:XP_011404325.1 PREDICTED: probable G-protein coupled receptor 157 [Amphimedon queenslandica]